MKSKHSTDLRNRVAREAALLIYTSQEKEYKQAKERASRMLRLRVIPSNIEVAEELDKIAEEKEGSSRKNNLLQMREEALGMLIALKDFNPRLVGSVWRGTAYKNSDIDIVAFSQDPQSVLEQLRKNEYHVESSSWSSVTKRGKKRSSFHIHLILSSGNNVEVLVHDDEKVGVLDRCEKYGDLITGLSQPQLITVLRNKPFQKFLPK